MEKIPTLYSLEHSPATSDGINPNEHIERRLSPLDVSNEYERRGRDESLIEARKELLNDRMFDLLLKAVVSKESRNVTGFAHIENMFVKYAENLSTTEINNLVTQFNQGFRKYINSMRGSLDLSNNQYAYVFEGRADIHSNGIQSVISFIRERKRLLNMAPGQDYAFYFNDILDARDKIDLIECIFSNEDGVLAVDTMNIIQIKSSDPTETEKIAITRAHKEWVTSSILDIEEFEKEYTDGIPENLTIETIAENADEIETLLLEIVTDPTGFNPQNFINNLNLGELSKKQQAWLLKKHSGAIKQVVFSAISQGIVDESDANQIIEALNKLEQAMMAKAKLPRNLSYIHEINSIVAVGPKIVQQESIVTRNIDPGKKKIIRT